MKIVSDEIGEILSVRRDVRERRDEREERDSRDLREARDQQEKQDSSEPHCFIASAGSP